MDNVLVIEQQGINGFLNIHNSSHYKAEFMQKIVQPYIIIKFANIYRTNNINTAL